MNVNMCLYPSYVSLGSASSYSPQLFQFLEQQGVELEDMPWDGTVEGLPTGQPTIIRASSRMHCSAKALALKCEELGHLAYYDDRLLLTSGEYSYEGLIEAATSFLERVRNYQPKAAEPTPEAPAGDNPVEVKLNVSQIKDGWKYDGEISFDGVGFYYALDFKVHVDKIGATLKPDEGAAGIKRVVTLTVKKTKDSNKAIELSEELWGFFISAVLQFAVNFYYNEQTRDSNQGFLGMVARDEFNPLGAKVSFGMSTTMRCERFPALVQLLDQNRQ